MSETFSKGYACIVGVGADLPCTIDDAKAISDILKDPERCAYPAHQVKLLTGKGAKRDDILTALDELANATDADSTVVLYFSGHGYRVESSIAQSYFLIPFGCRLESLRTTAISGAEFAQKLRAIPSKKLLVLLDCCHAGGFGEDTKNFGLEMTKAPLPPEAQAFLAEGRGSVAIASCQENERSLTGLPYSAFTTALVEAFSGRGAAKQDGYVRVMDLALYSREVVPRRTSDRQHPVVSSLKNADNFAVAYYAGGDKQPKLLPFSGQPQVEAENSNDRDRGQPTAGATQNAEQKGDGNIAINQARDITIDRR